MERDFNNDEFEFFLKQKADQYKIYPSEKSWRNIHNSLHSKWKWFTLGGSLLLLTGFFFFSNDLIFSNSSKASNSSKTSTKEKTASIQINSRSVNGSSYPQPAFSYQDKNIQPVAMPSSLGTLKKEGSADHAGLLENRPTSIGSQTPETSLLLVPVLASQQNVSLENTINVDANLPNQVAEDDLNLRSKVNMDIAPLIETEAVLSGEINWMQQMTAIKLGTQKKSPFHLQFYFSPSVSYRRLADNKATSNIGQQNVPLASGNSNIDRYVDHKPSIGAELGSNVLFSAGRNLTFKTGLQLNYSRYTIKAYKFYFEKASIALNSLGPVGDTITSYTSFRNFSGYSPEELQNQYLQISVPIGAELKLFGGKRLQLNVAGTIQPTYLLLNDSYLLSTDYVNYAKEPSLVRKWNVHTSMEAFISYKTGGVRWQVGPQFRYQLMSSYNDRYPIKEYLFEYGVKVGVSKTLY